VNSDLPETRGQKPEARRLKPASCWHALYTRSRNEKKVTERLISKGIEAYVPVQKVLHQWSDRKKWVEEPLIRSYVFVKILPEQYNEALNTPGAVRYIYFSGKAATIPDKQIEILKLISSNSIETSPVPNSITPGTPVKVISGPLAGLAGELIMIAGKKKVVVRIDHLEQALSFIISPAILEPI
jgi:transcription antitermination factor NusG